MRCHCFPVSPFTFKRKAPAPGARGDGDLDQVDDVVREDDADLKRPVVGKKAAVEQVFGCLQTPENYKANTRRENECARLILKADET